MKVCKKYQGKINYRTNNIRILGSYFLHTFEVKSFEKKITKNIIIK